MCVEGAFRGNTVRLAAQRGAAAVILYSDPAEAAPAGTDAGEWMTGIVIKMVIMQLPPSPTPSGCPRLLCNEALQNEVG